MTTRADRFEPASSGKRITMRRFALVVLLLVTMQLPIQSLGADWNVGAARIDVTPKEPVRLSGYGNRTQPTIEIDDPLTARAIALQHSDGATSIVVSIDAIGLSPTLSERIGDRVFKQFDVARTQLVLCSTHSHSAPHLEDVLPNLLTAPLTDAEQESMLRYSQSLVDSIVKVVGEAISRLEPAELDFGTGSAGFAVNRRVLKNGNWTGFGLTTDGAVDRTVRVIRAKRSSGETLAVLYQYACHCTSIAPERNRISADWAGLSATKIEAALRTESTQPIALPVIGCGADANPNPRNTYENAIAHAEEMAASVCSLCKGSLQQLPNVDSQSYELVALAPERPSRDRLKTMSESNSAVERRFGTSMLETLTRKGRLPETYPAPVHVWRFGEELAWVFLGGEVVVDYQIRLERELSQFKHVWVAAYTDDVFAYIASERLRAEGGYEVDASMLYYQQPGRWVSGTEDLLVSRILDLARTKRSIDTPLTPEQGLASIQMPKGWKLEMVACEPIVQDPVNVAFGADGAVWVLEMGDYPLGGPKSGQLKRLFDRDGDGHFESSSVFLDKLSYPAGLYPWRDGIVVACAPDVFIAYDRDGDGIADERRILITGFPFANPQHRVHGFTYGLDHRLHFGTGSEVKEIVEQSTGRRFQAHGSDLSLDVDSGQVCVETGSTQYIRSCDDWGNWFGNDNSHPLFHYAWNRSWSKFASRSPRTQIQHVLEPATAPPVFPISRESDRFNDLFAANRFTSACSSIFCRSPGAFPEMQSCALICEPVHNLVARFKIDTQGASFHGMRLPQDQHNEWMRSSDPWFRPVRIENAPDGTLWVVDMYRRVIEHPEWIPDDWQRRLNLRAGQDQGRIYRAYQSEFTPLPSRDWTKANTSELIDHLSHPSSAVSDIVRQQLVWRCRDDANNAKEVSRRIAQLMNSSDDPLLRLRTAATLVAIREMTISDWCSLVGDRDKRVARWAVERVAELGLVDDEVRNKLVEISKSTLANESTSLGLQLIVALSTCEPPALDSVARLLATHAGERWIDASNAVLPTMGIDNVIETLLQHSNARTDGMLNSLIAKSSLELQRQLREQIIHETRNRPAWHFQLSRQFTNSQDEKLQLATATTTKLTSEAIVAIEDTSNPPELKQAAIAWFVSQLKPDDKESLQRLCKALVNCESTSLSEAIIRGILSTGANGLDAILEKWAQFDVDTRSLVLSTCMTKLPDAMALMSRVESNKISIDDLQPTHREALRAMPSDVLQEKVRTLFGPPPGTDRAAIVRDYLQHWPQTVDVARGEALYKQHCVQCHQDRLDHHGEMIQSIGPNLQTLSSWVNEAWLAGIFDPNRAVEAKYRRVTLLTVDGQIRVGLKLRETDDAIDFVNDQGQFYSVAKSSIEEVKHSDKSLMPEGFEKVLKPTDAANIISFLRKK